MATGEQSRKTWNDAHDTCAESSGGQSGGTIGPPEGPVGGSGRCGPVLGGVSCTVPAVFGQLASHGQTWQVAFGPIGIIPGGKLARPQRFQQRSLAGQSRIYLTNTTSYTP